MYNWSFFDIIKPYLPIGANMYSFLPAVKNANGIQKLLLLLALGWVGTYLVLNFAAIGQGLEYFTGFDGVSSVISLVVVTYILKFLSQKGSLVYILTGFIWLCLTTMAVYWAIQYSDWSTYAVFFLTLNFVLAILSRLFNR